MLWRALCGDLKRTLTSHEQKEALIHCALHGEFIFAQKLIQNKITRLKEIKDSKGNGPLLIIMKSKAFSWEQKRILVDLLLKEERQDDINQVNQHQTTPLIYAAKKDLDTLKKLVKIESANINYQDRKGNTALHYAVAGNRPNTTQALLDDPRNDPNIQNMQGETPLHLTKSTDVAKRLMLKGAKTTLQDKNQKTPHDRAVLIKEQQLADVLKK